MGMMIATGRIVCVVRLGVSNSWGPPELAHPDNERFFQQATLVHVFQQRGQTLVGRGQQCLAQQWKIVGNGVHRNVAYALGLELKKALERSGKTLKRLTGTRKRKRMT